MLISCVGNFCWCSNRKTCLILFFSHLWLQLRPGTYLVVSCGVFFFTRSTSTKHCCNMGFLCLFAILYHFSLPLLTFSLSLWSTSCIKRICGNNQLKVLVTDCDRPRLETSHLPLLRCLMYLTDKYQHFWGSRFLFSFLFLQAERGEILLARDRRVMEIRTIYFSSIICERGSKNSALGSTMFFKRFLAKLDHQILDLVFYLQKEETQGVLEAVKRGSPGRAQILGDGELQWEQGLAQQGPEVGGEERRRMELWRELQLSAVCTKTSWNIWKGWAVLSLQVVSSFSVVVDIFCGGWHFVVQNQRCILSCDSALCTHTNMPKMWMDICNTKIMRNLISSLGCEFNDNLKESNSWLFFSLKESNSWLVFFLPPQGEFHSRAEQNNLVRLLGDFFSQTLRNLIHRHRKTARKRCHNWIYVNSDCIFSSCLFL